MTITAVFFILVETILEFPIIASILLALPVLALLWVLIAKRKNWQSSKKPALFVGLLAGVVAFFGLPAVFHSSLSEMSYYVDWLFHLGYCLAITVYVGLITWFFLAPLRA